MSQAASGVTDGLVLIDKAPGLTSQRVVKGVRQALALRKAGHAGTLDPSATGLLVVGIGRATRLLGYLSDQDKTYEATIRLGQATTTDDADGEPLGPVQAAAGLSPAVIEAAMRHYVGAIEQVPSSVSAVKVNGRRAYAMVRAGQAVSLPPRLVTVSRFELTARRDRGPLIDLGVVVDCSSGTYIRALARDLGHDLGVGGHVVALRRTRVGTLDVSRAVPLERLGPADVADLATVAALIAPRIDVDDDVARLIAVGAGLDLALAGRLAALFWRGQPLALYRVDPDDPARARPAVVLVDSAAGVGALGR